MVSAPAPRPRLRGDANREDVLRRVVDATERLLAAGATFSDIPIERLAAEAGIARSTFYVHFRDRSALLRQMTSLVMEDLYDVSVPLLALDPDATQADWRVTMHALIDAFRRHELLVGPILAAATYDSEVSAAYELVIGRAATALEAVIVNRHRPNARPIAMPRETATALVRMVERTVVQEAMGASASRRDRIADTLAQIAWNALYRDE